MAIYSQYKSEAARDRIFKTYDSRLAIWPVPCETRFVETTFGPTHLIACGPAAAPPLLLIHGLGSDATSWLPNVSPLADRYRVYALDTIGAPGKSAGTTLLYRNGDHVRWLSEVFERLGIGRARVTGWSLGGWIGFRFALAFPGRVDRLALLEPASLYRTNNRFLLGIILSGYLPSEARIRKFMQSWASPCYPPLPDEYIERIVVRNKAVRRAKFQVPSAIRDAELASLEVPTLLIMGRDSPIYDVPKAASRVRSVAPHIRIEIIPDAGHLFPMERPEATNEALIEFFA
jgi:pimeloyl-ACP methyl ester carboxylesterase